jgi:thioredoxin
LESDLPVLLDCWAAWCGPCHMLAPAIDALAEQYVGRLKVCKLNVEVATQAASELKVMALPTLIAFRQGLPLDRQMGVQSTDRISAWLRGLGMI